jgi:hypothetical protein
MQRQARLGLVRIVLKTKRAGQYAKCGRGLNLSNLEALRAKGRSLKLMPGRKGEAMRIRVTKAAGILGGCLLVLALFAGGYVAGQNKFGQPKTIIHMVILKWNPGVSDADKQGALEGVKEMAAKIPGVKNIWIKAERLQPRDFNAAFAIEFQNRAAADAYAESPIHQAWEQKYTLLREQSVSEQVTNP